MRRSVLFFAMPEYSHFQGLLPLVARVARRGVRAVVFADRRYQANVEAAGGEFVDVFAGAPLESVDGFSRPVPCRYVSFAGHRGEALARQAAGFAPALVVYDTFAPVGRVVATELRLPYVSVCGGHAVPPAHHLAALDRDPRVALADACHEAVSALRERHGWADASPFAYVTALSPYLNVVPQPPGFLPAEAQAPFEPAAFFGALPDRMSPPTLRHFRGGDATCKLYASFGTVVWRYFGAEALAALRTLRDAVAGRHDRELVLSLGGAAIGPADRAALEASNVQVLPFADQWALLGEADGFLTHHGLRSTHEAIYQRCPMLSYPFFWDQPQLAARCAELSLALPLADKPRAPLSRATVEDALERLATDRAAWHARLDRARTWEIETLAQRERVVERMLALAR